MQDQPFEIYRPDANGSSGLLFICDHASNGLPSAYGTLGVPAADFGRHIAYDIGAAMVTRALAQSYGAAAVLARYSRLLIDLNRGPDDPTLVMKLSDGRIVPGNRDADAVEIARRLRDYYRPYHDAIAAEIAAMRAAGQVPVLISMHSFTPVWKGYTRPWDVGVLWDRDGRLALPLIRTLRAQGFTAGDNEPYSGELENDCMWQHGTMNGLPHALIEMRQDLIANRTAASAFALRLKPALDAALEMMGAPQVQFTRPLAAISGETAMDENTKTQLEAAAFRRLVAHLRERSDVQNIDLMNLAGFCRNCLGDWYREAAGEKGIVLEKDAAREIVYGMAPAEWKRLYQREASPESQAKFAAGQKTHS